MRGKYNTKASMIIRNELLIKEAVSKSFSVAQVLRYVGLHVGGANYQGFHKAVKDFKIDTSHFTGQGHLKGRTHSYGTKPLETLLVENRFYSSNAIKKRLLKDKVHKHKCDCCGLTKWLKRPIPLELHHINGKRDDNRIENIELLCPNCHALTDNYRGKNKGKKY
jgi:hypothetical protein